MKKRNKVILASSTVFVLMVALAIYFVWPRDHNDIEFRQARVSPDGKWIAVVQLEVYNTAWVVNDAVFAVRLKGPAQKDHQGDLVMNVPVNYPDPAPSVEWTDGKLVVTLAHHQKYQYFRTPVDEVAVAVQQVPTRYEDKQK
jgi:hypothetical protein